MQKNLKIVVLFRSSSSCSLILGCVGLKSYICYAFLMSSKVRNWGFFMAFLGQIIELLDEENKILL
jgi:uncharacterized membrane protein (UPF0136 family)